MRIEGMLTSGAIPIMTSARRRLRSTCAILVLLQKGRDRDCINQGAWRGDLGFARRKTVLAKGTSRETREGAWDGFREGFNLERLCASQNAGVEPPAIRAPRPT